MTTAAALLSADSGAHAHEDLELSLAELTARVTALEHPTLTAQVLTFPAPAPAPSSPASGWEVRVAGSPTWVHQTPFGLVASYATDAAGPVPVEVSPPPASLPITSVRVRPKRRNLYAVTAGDGDRALFTVPPNFFGHLVIDVNGTALPLFLTATSLSEVQRLNAEASNLQFTHVFKPGIHYVGELVLTTGQSALVKPGALVIGRFRLGSSSPTGPRASNVRVAGHGIIDSSLDPSTPGRPLRIQNVDYASLEGSIGLIGKTHWGAVLYGSSRVTGRGLRVLNFLDPAVPTGTPDGIDIVASSDVLLEDTLYRAHDDGISLKCAKNGWSGPVRSVTIRNSTAIQGDAGNGFGIGWENAAGFAIEDVLVDGLDLVRKTVKPNSPLRRGGLSINLAGSSPVRRVTIRNAVVEEQTGESAIRVTTFASSDYPDPNRASISDVSFEDVSVPDLPIVLESADPAKPITGLRFVNCTKGGVPITSVAQLQVKNCGSIAITYDS